MKLTNPVEDLIQRSIDGELSHEEIEQLDRHLATHQDDAALHPQVEAAIGDHKRNGPYSHDGASS